MKLRKIPKCFYCGAPIAREVVDEESIKNKVVGDAFMRWEYFPCTCKKSQNKEKF